MFQRSIFFVILGLAGCATQQPPQSVVQTVWQNPDVQRDAEPRPKPKTIKVKATPQPVPKPATVSKKPPPKKQLPKIKTPKLSNMAIAKLIVRDSRARYRGNCACPYDTDRAGRSCGRRSAYSRPGGYAPLCYERDVKAADIQKYKARD